MESISLKLLFAVITFHCGLISCQERKLRNVLHIIADDMRTEIESYVGSDNAIFPEIYTPSLEALSHEAITFMQAYDNYPICGASRSSFLTGRRPETTRVYNNKQYFREEGGNFTTMPQYFKENGYVSIGAGKVFHGNEDSGGVDLEYSWDEFWDAPNLDEWDIGWSWRAVDTDRLDEPLPDVYVKDYAIQKLEELAPAAISGEQPFYLSIGFRKPHLSFYAPTEFYDLYPISNISLPSNPWVLDDFPEVGWDPCYELQGKTDFELLNITLEFNTTTPDFKTIELRRGYYAALSFTDSLIGEVMNSLDELGLRDNTVVVFSADHGWALGEHAMWCKDSGFSMVNRVPLYISTPDMTDQDRGTLSETPVELVDLMPTIVKAAGLGELDLCPEDSSEIDLCREGTDILERVPDPEKWKTAVFYQNLQQRDTGPIMSFSTRTALYRYSQYVDFDLESNEANWDMVRGEELYDLTQDPDENYNKAYAAEYADVRAEMEQILKDGWRAQLPS